MVPFMVDVAIKSTDGNPLVYLPRHDIYPDDLLRGILSKVRTIAVVGASTNWKRPSFYAMKYLVNKGYKVIPVNPTRVGEELFGERVIDSIADYPGKLDMIDIFRTSEEAYDVTKDVIAN